MLDLFEPYLVNPVKTRYRLTTPIDADVLANHNARLSGLSALPFFSDLAHDPSRLVVEISHEDIVALRGALGDAWQETAWSENASLIIEEWSYPIDVPSNSSMTCTNLECVDPWSLYAELISERFDDVRVEDAIEQLREHLYR